MATNKPIPGATKKEERQYEHIKDSAIRSGRYGGEKGAKRVAAATVNKERRKRGETKKK